MALYRPVHVTFWQDPKVLEEMTPEDKLFYLYLITNPKTTQIGIYQITKKQMSFELGYSIESINALVDRFEKHHKLIKYDIKTRELCIINWGKYNFPRAGTPIENCVKKELSEVKNKAFIKDISEKVTNKKIKAIFEQYLHCDSYKFRDIDRDEGNNNNNHNNKGEKIVVVSEKIKEYFNLNENDIKKIAKTFVDTKRDIDYLIEKLEITKRNPSIRDVVGFLIKALVDDYKASISINETKIPKTKFHNFTENFLDGFESEEDFDRHIEDKLR